MGRRPKGPDGKYAAEIYAEMIFMHIPVGSDAAPISRDALAQATGLDPQKVSDGIAYMRDHFPDLPLVSSWYGYVFTDRYSETYTYLQWRARHAQTGMRRMVSGAIVPYLQQHRVDPVRARMVERSLVRLMEDMDDLIDIDPPDNDLVDSLPPDV